MTSPPPTVQTIAALHLSPVQRQILAIRTALTGPAAPAEPTFADVIDHLGPQSHVLVILVFSLLNMLPGPPGYGGTIAIATFAFALAMVLGRPIRLPNFVGHRRVPLKLLLKLLDRLEKFSHWLTRLSHPRWQRFAHDSMRLPFGILVMVLCIPMVVPVPFMNAVPNVGIFVLCLSRLNRDGIGMLVGAIIGGLGVLLDLAILWGLWHLAMQAGGMLW